MDYFSCLSFHLEASIKRSNIISNIKHVSGCPMPHSHQSLNTFKSCSIKQGLKLFSLQKLFADFFSTANLVQMKKQVKAHLNSLFKLVIQLSVAEFHFVKPGLIKHVLLV